MLEEPEIDAEQIAAVFHEVVDLDAAARESHYRAHDVPPQVRSEVEALLGQESHGGFEDEGAEDAWQRLTADLEAARQSIELAPGTKIGGSGDYEIVREIARGGMGAVFEAQQSSLSRRVALKVIRDARFADGEARQRFHAEAEAIARLDHSGILPIYEVAEHEGLPFYSMAYLPGGSLDDLPRPVAPEFAARLLADVCDAVHYAHSQNIVHRDLKPSNVLLTESLQPRVTDFGLAKDTREDSNLTRTGVVIGTPGFMAPEQAGGGDAEDAIDHRADVYGLGGVLFHLLCGRAPILGRTLAETLHRVVHDDVPDPRQFDPDIPADLAGICRKALEKEPRRRYGTAAAMAEDLRRFLAGVPTEARPLSRREKVVRWCRKNPAVTALTAATTLAVLGGLAATSWYAVELQGRTKELARQTQDLIAARNDAEEARGDAEAFSAFLIHDVLRPTRPRIRSKVSTDAKLKDVLLEAIPRLDVRFEGRPLARALARHELAVTLSTASVHEPACEQLRLALETRERELGPLADDTLSSLNAYATATFQAGDFEKAVELLETLDNRSGGTTREIREACLSNLAGSYARCGRRDDAVKTYARALEFAEGIARVNILASMATLHAEMKNPEEARATQNRARAQFDRIESPTDHERIYFALEIIYCLEQLEDDEALIAEIAPLMPTLRRSYGKFNVVTSNVAQVLVGAYRRQGRPADAAAELERTVPAGRNHPLIRERLELCARLYLQAGDDEKALLRAERCHALWREKGAELPATFLAEALYCETLVRVGRLESARTILERARARLRQHVERTKDGSPETRPSRDEYEQALARFDALADDLR